MTNGESVERWMKTFPASRADEMKQLVGDCLARGWYLNEVFIFAILRDFERDKHDLDSFLEDQIIGLWGVFWRSIIALFPQRKSLLTESKKVFENECYAAAIHLYFSQADGIFHETFGKQLFKHEGVVAKEKFDSHLSDGISRESWDELVNHFKDGSVLRRMYSEAYRAGFSITATDLTKNTTQIIEEGNLVIPNRHGVLHGIHKGYGTRRNALKCLSLLMFVIFAIHGDAVYAEHHA